MERVFEHDASTQRLLHHSGKHLNISSIASKKVTIPPARYFVNEHPLQLQYGPQLHLGDSHAFVHHPLSGALLGGWGPGLHLRRLTSTLFVNIHVEETKEKLASVKTFPHAVRQYDSVQNETYHYRENFSEEREIYFDIGIAFDSRFCQVHGGDPVDVTLLAHGVGTVAHEMALTGLVSLRIGDVIGFCRSTTEYAPQNVTTPAQISGDESDLTIEDSASDRFGPPSRKEQNSCIEKGKKECTVPGLRLDVFRKKWKKYINNSSKSDAVFLLTEAKTKAGGGIIGAAWTSSVCSDFGYGWVLGDHPVIIAHEIGHTLGAPHAKRGLMFPYLQLGGTAKYDRPSLAAIERFVSRLAGQKCLKSSTTGETGRRRLEGFVRISKRKNNGVTLEGSDIAVGKVRTEGQSALLMLQVERHSSDEVRASVRMTTLHRTADIGFPFSYDRKIFGREVPGSDILDIEAGGGIATASLINPTRDDVICVLLSKTKQKLFYSVGFHVDRFHKEVVLDGWSDLQFIPMEFQGKVLAIGATAGEVHSKGKTDLIIAYIELYTNPITNESVAAARYIIGSDIEGRSAIARGGWAPPVSIPIVGNFSLSADPTRIGDISVDLWKFPTPNGTDSGETRMLFSIIAKTKGSSAFKTLVAVQTREPAWNFYVPDIKPRSSKRMTGGIALIRLLSPSAPVATSIVYQNRVFQHSRSQWIDIGDGVLTGEIPEDPGEPEQLALSVGEDIVPDDTCTRCYAAQFEEKCKERTQTCFLKREFGRVELVQAQNSLPMNTRQIRVGTSGTDGSLNVTDSLVEFKPKSDSLFCLGFHSIFVSQSLSPTAESGKCDWDARRINIIAEGLRVSVIDSLRAYNGSVMESVESVTVNITLGEIPEELEGISSAAHGTAIQKLKVNVRTKVAFRSEIIEKAFDEIKLRQGFNSLFLILHEKNSKTFKLSDRHYRVTVAFSIAAQAVFLQANDPETTIAATIK